MLLSITEFIGRFHPVIVHLPIGVLLIALFLQWLSSYEKYRISKEAIKIILLIGCLSAIIACITGYLLSLSGDYDSDLVTWHMWMGISVAAASLLMTFLLFRKQHKLIHITTSFSLLMLVVLTGHLGGSLTHGANYLTAALEDEPGMVEPVNNIADIQEAAVYDDVIQPILQQKCYSCHNARKQKGGLRLDDHELLMKGGKNGRVILAGKAAESEMIKRLLLPPQDEDHMPPKEKPQLTEKQIALIHWWIDEGATFNKKVNELNQPEKLKPALLALQGNQAVDIAPATVPTTEVEKADDNAIVALKEAGAVVVAVAKGSNYLMANFVTATNLTDEQLKLLLPIKKQLVWLKMGHTKVTDEGLTYIGGCTNITLLHLNNTAITDKGIPMLNTLSNLQVLNVVNTDVTANGLQQLNNLKKLRSIYLYKTQVNGTDIARLRTMFPGTLLDTGNYTLPMLTTDTQIVKAAIR